MTPETELRDRAALERTRLANERTLLAYIRTALAIVVSGFGLQLLEGRVAELGSVALVLAGVLMIPFGLWRYIHVRKQLTGTRSFGDLDD